MFGDNQVRARIGPVVRKGLGIDDKNDPEVIECIEDVFLRVRKLIDNSTDKDTLITIINHEAEKILGQDSLSDNWSAIVDRDINNDKIVKSELELERIEIEKILEKYHYNIGSLSDYKLQKIVSFILKNNGFLNPLDYFVPNTSFEIEDEYEFFDDFNSIYKSIIGDNFVYDNDDRSNLFAFVSKLHYKNNLYIQTVKAIRKTYKYREDLEQLSIDEFKSIDFYKGIKGLDLICIILGRKIHKITKQIYLEFLNTINFPLYNEIKVNPISEGFIPGDPSSSSKSGYYDKNKKNNDTDNQKDEKENSDTDENEDKNKSNADIAINILERNDYKNVLELILLRENFKISGDFSPYTSFRDMMRDLFNVEKRYSFLSVKEINEAVYRFGWKNVREISKELINIDLILGVTDLKKFLNQPFYTISRKGQDDIILNGEWFIIKVLNLPVNKNITEYVFKKFVERVRGESVAQELTKRTIERNIEEQRKQRQSREKITPVSNNIKPKKTKKTKKQRSNDINKTKSNISKAKVSLETQKYKSILDFLAARELNKFTGDFTPFKDFLDIFNSCVSIQKSDVSYITVQNLKELALLLGWDMLDRNFTKKFISTKIIPKDFEGFQKSIVYENKTLGISLSWGFLIKSYLGKNSVQLSNRIIDDFFNEINVIY